VDQPIRLENSHQIKLFFTNHISREVKYYDYTSWKIWNPT